MSGRNRRLYRGEDDPVLHNRYGTHHEEPGEGRADAQDGAINYGPMRERDRPREDDVPDYCAVKLEYSE